MTDMCYVTRHVCDVSLEMSPTYPKKVSPKDRQCRAADISADLSAISFYLSECIDML
jgi:hypothetical protein